MNARDLFRRTTNRTAAVAGASALLIGGLGASVLLPASAASASTTAACTGSSLAAGTSCTLTGTATLTGGALTLVSQPTALAWSGTIGALNTSLVDTTAGHTTLTIDDATGSGAGWNVNVSATTFSAGSHALPATGTVAFTGSSTSATATTAPDATCYAGSTCTLPSNTATTYPLALTTAATSPTAVKIYDSAANTGMGQITIGATSPAAWWVNVPASTYAGTYTSTFTFTYQLTSAP